MNKTILFDRVKKIALENIGPIRHIVCETVNPRLIVVKHYLETGEALRTQAYGCPNVMSKITEAVESFIRGLDVRCIGELLELIPKGMDNRLPGWLYGPVVACLGEDGWELAPAA